MVPCLVTLTDLSTRRAVLAALAVLLVIEFVGLYLFHDLCLPWQSVHYSLSQVQKCNNVRDRYEVPDFWPSNSPDLNSFHHKIWDSECTRKSARYEWFEAASDWCVSWNETERNWRLHRPVAQSSPCLHSSHKRTFWIFIVTYVMQNIINCNKLS